MIENIAPLRYPAKLIEARIPASVTLRYSWSIGGSRDVKANLATPIPTMIENIPAIKIAVLEFLFNK